MEKKLIATSGNTIGVFENPAGFDDWQRLAMALSTSTLVPQQYQGKNNVGSCLIALDMSSRMKVSPLMLMQNMDVIHGKPSLSSKFVIAQLNNSGKFSPLRFEMKDLGEKTVEYGYKDKSTNSWKKEKIKIMDRACRAVAKDLKSDEVLEGEWVTLEVAVKEGWYGKSGSKWQTMPGQMLRYRAASWWANIYHPEGKLGLPTNDELIDQGQPIVAAANSTVDDLNTIIVEKTKVDKKPPKEEIEEVEIVEKVEETVVVENAPPNENGGDSDGETPPNDNPDQLI